MRSVALLPGTSVFAIPLLHGNAINHLASADHLKNLKSFLWNYGGKMDQVDSFRISEEDLAKWEKKCTLLKSGTVNEGSHRPLIGPSNDIHNELNSECYMDSHQSRVCNGDKCLANGSLSNGGMYQAHPDERMVNRESSSQGLQILTQISVIAQQETKGNVHSGAPPPWLDATEGKLLNVGPKPDLGASSLNKSGKSQKLNPKRVGAAWAEKRKREMEMEKRGEISPNKFDANWLPNFGRVWQSGSRKESRKEFVVENKNELTGETQSETSIDIQPYVSKRMVSFTSMHMPVESLQSKEFSVL
ncbi:coiled coil protein [Actinidia rufa]|uniref:Coiled coil protein n=1 Tax=Actinidia rufa TaxID=165716 RepID=A0A7J0GB25_9ERIC|nr:coiled coil protein [Actinidia rufa]